MDVPQSAVGFVLGARGATLREFETRFRTFMLALPPASTLHLKSSTLHLKSSTLHLKSPTLHLNSSYLHPSPYTLNPKP